MPQTKPSREINVFKTRNAREMRDGTLRLDQLRKLHRIAPDEWRTYVDRVFVSRYRRTISWRRVCLDCINNAVADATAAVSDGEIESLKT